MHRQVCNLEVQPGGFGLARGYFTGLCGAWMGGKMRVWYFCRGSKSCGGTDDER